MSLKINTKFQFQVMIGETNYSFTIEGETKENAAETLVKNLREIISMVEEKK